MNYFGILTDERIFEGYNVTKQGNETVYMLAEELGCSADDAVNLILEYARIHWNDLLEEIRGEGK